MTRSTAKRINDILDAIEKCRRYSTECAELGPQTADLVSDAVIRNLEIIGEAVNHLPRQVTDSHPEIPWSAIVGMRNNLVHQYFNIDLAIVQEVIERDLLPLAEVLKRYVHHSA